MGKKINKSLFKRAKANVSVSPGEMLKTLRELQELSQTELAELSGLNQSHISAMENGRTQIGRERALKLAIALKTHPGLILFPNFDVSQIAS